MNVWTHTWDPDKRSLSVAWVVDYAQVPRVGETVEVIDPPWGPDGPDLWVVHSVRHIAVGKDPYQGAALSIVLTPNEWKP